MAVGLKKRRRIQLVIAAGVLLAAATGLVGYAMRDGIEFFRSPSQVAAAPVPDGERFRLGGLVAEGTVVKDGGEVRFEVTDGGATLPVVFKGIPPDLFREGQGVVATGEIESGTFVASEILAKHDENYMPKEVADALKDQGLFHPDDAAGAKPGS
ncbi:cytochrome c-type biogenesis protein CcmE [Amaricoccus macauensis]|uniref:Cytochrome c-type biogenesis protein CcmE n=1 Tax=Amaricoccus macauensis TaxID=57001 RepID=A0A840SRH9_9RHOB|nr:cytochrome c maturation protein CcmE [Amaricoccus macauensis]MBB5223128.1 cytochrome c-type biogenesis protein CcmE [Amaricoccus macauensis]